MKMSNKKGFTIVELVIVIAVIAILAAVLIPTFSGVVDKANASAAQQTAKSSLTNALTMSSTAQLSKGTKILVDGYAFNYTGNQLESTDYPTEDNKITFSLDYDATAGDDATAFNAIIISADSLYGNTNAKLVSDTDYEAKDEVMAVKNDVAKILAVVDEGTLGCGAEIDDVTCVMDDKTAHYYVNITSTKVSSGWNDDTTYYSLDNGVYTEDTETPTSGDHYTITYDAEIYVNSDLDKDVVIFTTFAN